VTGDPGRLRQILVNLVGNALKFTPAGSVSVRAAVESSSSREIFVRFAVTDTGIGIPSEKQSVIFQSFAQADGSMTRKYGGAGLGLSISMLLVELMGGHMGIASEPGKGSTFHFSACFTRTESEQESNANELVGHAPS
jgi:signal transduction histidine kinase